MTGILICHDGARYELPAPISWKLQYGTGVPCDSFEVVCPCGTAPDPAVGESVGFEAVENGKSVFRGVVDESEYRWSDGGGRLLITGRGMAALLLDNEAEAAEYQMATLEDILRDHVYPYGIQVAEKTQLPAVAGFTVASGSSEWQVLYEFVRYHGGIEPRFNAQGALVLAPWQDRERLVADDFVPVTELAYRQRRYGVLSEVLVRDRGKKATQRVVNQDFIRRGGRCRRVVTMPGRSSYQAMRYSGQFQLEQSAAKELRVELTVPQPFFAFPGERLEFKRERPDVEGIWRVLEAETGADERGAYTRLTLGGK
ncbi:MAG: hypothetical protein RRY53_00685 [Pseudoflavonifractor sp.]